MNERCKHRADQDEQMDPLPAVAHAHSVSIEFTNDSGEYRATLDVRPRVRPDGSLVVNTELELFRRSSDADYPWEDLAVPGALAEFQPDDDRIGGGVGTELRSTRLDVGWRGERGGDSGLLLTEVDVRLSSRYDD